MLTHQISSSPDDLPNQLSFSRGQSRIEKVQNIGAFTGANTSFSFNFDDATTDERGQTVIEAALSFVSTLVGCGIVCLPYALAQAGLSLGVVFHFVMVCLLLVAVKLYFEAKDNLGYE